MKSIVTCDLEGVIEKINPDGEKLFGYKKEDAIIFKIGEVKKLNQIIN